MVRLECQPKIILSSLTFKHLFPTFEKALGNVARQADPNAVFIFDLLEGDRQYFENDGVIFIRMYTRDEVRDILARIGLRLVALDTVEHDPEHRQMLVVATNSSLAKNI
jgi:hypothetical protein